MGLKLKYNKVDALEDTSLEECYYQLKDVSEDKTKMKLTVTSKLFSSEIREKHPK